jgi:NAD-dependent DNA ligase
MAWAGTDRLAEMNRLRRNVIMHSVIYYRFNKNLISDCEYDQLCVKLDIMQTQNVELCNEAVYAEDFKDYDPSTGMNFIDHEWGIRAAQRLLTSLSRKLHTL